MIKVITIEEVEHIAFTITRELFSYNEPIPDFKTRFPHRLESCIATPFQGFGAVQLYPTLVAKAGILFYLMNKNHPFQNGNKRVAVTTLFYFLAINGKWLRVSPEELYEFAVDIASSKPWYKEDTIKNIHAFLKRYMIEWKDRHKYFT